DGAILPGVAGGSERQAPAATCPGTAADRGFQGAETVPQAASWESEVCEHKRRELRRLLAVENPPQQRVAGHAAGFDLARPRTRAAAAVRENEPASRRSEDGRVKDIYNS